MSSRPSRLVAHPGIFRMFMEGKFDAYVLWPFAKSFQIWIVDRSTACNFTVFKNLTKYFDFKSVQSFHYGIFLVFFSLLISTYDQTKRLETAGKIGKYSELKIQLQIHCGKFLPGGWISNVPFTNGRLYFLAVYINVSSVVEFQRWWVLKSKLFAQDQHAERKF